MFNWGGGGFKYFMLKTNAFHHEILVTDIVCEISMFSMKGEVRLVKVIYVHFASLVTLIRLMIGLC